MNEIEILGDYLGTWTREIESVGFFCSSQVMELENQMLWEIGLISPDNPSYTGIHQPEFVSRSVDGLDTRKFEVPFLSSTSFCLCERSNESSRRRINMDWDIDSSLGLEIIQDL